MEYFRFRIFRGNYFKFCARSSPLFSITEKHSFIHFISVGSISVCISIVFICDRRSLCGSRNPDLCENNKKGFIYN